MSKFSIIIKAAALERMIDGLTTDNLRESLEAAGQVIINSTKVGYQKQVGPDGKKWSDNPPWYKAMKGGSQVLTGPTSAAVKGGPYAGNFAFSKVNPDRMRNSLIKMVSVAEKKVTVKYAPRVEPRAELTQEGGEGKIILNSTSGNKSVTLNVDITPRTHLGVAENYNRLGFKTDPQHIEAVFGGMMDDVLGD
jgi:hypothetical protein